MIDEILLQVSGLNLVPAALPKSKSTLYIGLIWATDNIVPTYISVCPQCEIEHKWRTTGLLPDYIQCEKCGIKFRP